MANLATDQALLTECRNTVIEIFKEDPTLQSEKNHLLRSFLARKSDGIAWDKIS